MKLSANKLSIKGLLLVSVLLLLEMLFVGCYAWLLTKAEEESTKQQQTKEIIARTNDLLKSLFDAGDNLIKYSFPRLGLSRDQASLGRYEAARNDIPKEIAWLKEQLQSDPGQLKLLEKIESDIGSALKILAELRRTTDTEAPMVAMSHAIKLRVKMQAYTEVLAHDFIDFLDTEKKIESESPAIMRFQRECLRWLLFLGLAINLIAAVMLARFFIRGITSRLAIVVENSDRLRQRQALRSPLPGSDEIALLDTAFHEMSQALRGEEELVMASEQQVRAIIDQLPIGLVIIAAEEDIEYANPTLERMLDYDNGALVGTKLSSHFSTTGHNSVALSDTTSIEGVVELVAFKKDRDELIVEFSVVDVSLGNLFRRLAIVVDVSEKHEVEKMRQAFVAMVSHELRTPLTSVAGFLQLLPMGVYGPIESRLTNASRHTEGHVEQLIMLINDLLDLEKLQAGKLEMKKGTVVLEDIIDAAVDSVYNLAEAQEVSVMFEGCEIDVAADSERLKQAISKMLTCFLRFCPAGETIDLTVEAPAGSVVTVCLTSSNVVIPDDKMQSIFEPFHRLELPSVTGSLGLGLTLARAIVLQHGGACGAKTAASGGTSLWLQIPCITGK